MALVAAMPLTAAAQAQRSEPDVQIVERRFGDLRARYAPDGTLAISNPVTGRTVTVPPKSAPEHNQTGSADRDTPYDGLIVEHARQNNVRPELVRAVVKVESNFNPYALSPKGAMGLMQLMPATARELNVANPFDPEQNIRGGSAYLRQLLDRYGDNEELALAAYNAGPAAVDKYGQAIPPYRETQRYVVKVSEIAGDDEGAVSVVPRTGAKIYKVTQIIDGREVITVTTTRPR
jgi:soluble lytic murein transglycosylase-like protein